MLTITFPRGDSSLKIPSAHQRYAKVLKPFVARDDTSKLASLFLSAQKDKPLRLFATTGTTYRAALVSDVGYELSVGEGETLLDYDGAVLPSELLAKEPGVITIERRKMFQIATWKTPVVELVVTAERFPNHQRFPVQTLVVRGEEPPAFEQNLPKSPSWVVDVDVATLKKALAACGRASLAAHQAWFDQGERARIARGDKTPVHKGDTPLVSITLTQKAAKGRTGAGDSTFSMTVAQAKEGPEHGKPGAPPPLSILIEGALVAEEAPQTRRKLTVGVMGDLFVRMLTASDWKRARVTFGDAFDAIAFRHVPEVLVAQPQRAGDVLVGMPARIV
jgi:hypothetical protein